MEFSAKRVQYAFDFGTVIKVDIYIQFETEIFFDLPKTKKNSCYIYLHLE